MPGWRNGGRSVRFHHLCKAFRCAPARNRSTTSFTGRNGSLTVTKCVISTHENTASERKVRYLPAWPPSFKPTGLRHRFREWNRYHFMHSSSFSDLERIAKCLVEEETQQTAVATATDSIGSSHQEEFPSSKPFPFEGDTSEAIDGETGHRASSEDVARVVPEDDSFTVGRRDTQEGRFYHIVAGVERSEFNLPSVTTILETTMTPSTYFSLRNWRKSQVKEYGEEEFKRMNAERMTIGTRFHQQLEARLLKETQLLSIKSRIEKEPKMVFPQKSLSQSRHCTLHELTDQSILHDTFPSEDKKDNRRTETVSSRFAASTCSVGTSSLEDEPAPALREPKTVNLLRKKVSSRFAASTSSVGAASVKHEPTPALREPKTEHQLRGKVSSRFAASSLEDEPAVREPKAQDVKTAKLFKSVQHVLDDITEVVALETVVAHLSLGYTGTCDCIAKYRGELCVIDWKTSSKPRPSLSDCYDFPLQTAAYAGAVNQDTNYPFKVYNALIVVTYPTGEPAHAHFLSHEQCLQAWHKWLERLEDYRTRFAYDLSNVYV